MKVLVTGVTGQLGYDVAAELARRGIENKGVGSKDMDLTDAKLVYISTDYVFSGEGNLPFAVDAEKFPVNMYGMTKLFGEQAVQMLLQKYFIIRISWVFGRNGNNFIKTMLRLGKERKELNVVAD